MNNRYFWGTPHTDTDVNAFEAAIRSRVYGVASGEFAAVAVVERSLEQIARRSATLLQFDSILAGVTLLFAYRISELPPDFYSQLNRWAIGLALLSCLVLLPNLALIWPSSGSNAVANAREAYLLSMGVHKTRAARFTIALILSFVAIVFALISVLRFS